MPAAAGGPVAEEHTIAARVSIECRCCCGFGVLICPSSHLCLTLQQALLQLLNAPHNLGPQFTVAGGRGDRCCLCGCCQGGCHRCVHLIRDLSYGLQQSTVHGVSRLVSPDSPCARIAKFRCCSGSVLDQLRAEQAPQSDRPGCGAVTRACLRSGESPSVCRRIEQHFADGACGLVGEAAW